MECTPRFTFAGNLNDWGESNAQLGRRYDPTEGPAACSPIGPIVNAAFASDTNRCHVLLASAALGPLHRQGSVMSHGDSDRARHRDLDRRYGQRAPQSLLPEMRTGVSLGRSDFVGSDMQRVCSSRPIPVYALGEGVTPNSQKPRTPLGRSRPIDDNHRSRAGDGRLIGGELTTRPGFIHAEGLALNR